MQSIGRMMPILGRVVFPNHPHHVVQRGHNKQVVFAEEADFRYYLRTLEKSSKISMASRCTDSV